MISLQKITYDNFYEILTLEPFEEQKNFVARNIYSLAEAYVALTNKTSIPETFAIYHDETLVGFTMIAYSEKDEEDDDDEDAYHIWRIMIDKKYQGKGYGKKAFAKIIEYIKTFPLGKANIAWLSYSPNNLVAKKLYQSFGFEETNEYENDEVIAVLKL
ncbi:MAG TPA: GNAT family N-acetyltransferase [Haloplasmataceae bacterium]